MSALTSSASGRWAMRLVVGLAMLGGLVLWWRYGLPVGMADAVWLCLPY